MNEDEKMVNQNEFDESDYRNRFHKMLKREDEYTKNPYLNSEEVDDFEKIKERYNELVTEFNLVRGFLIRLDGTGCFMDTIQKAKFIK